MAIRRVEALNRIMQQSGKTYSNEVIGELNRCASKPPVLLEKFLANPSLLIARPPSKQM
jgi:hypothetical protein